MYSSREYSSRTHHRKCREYSWVLRGFEYSLVVLVLKYECLSTTIEYSLCNTECLRVLMVQILSTILDFCKLLIALYSVQYCFSTFILFRYKVNNKNTIVHWEITNRLSLRTEHITLRLGFFIENMNTHLTFTKWKHVLMEIQQQ